MRVLFAGTSDFALPTLDAVAAGPHDLIGVLTQPDRPAGRGRRLTTSPVKQRAQQLQLPVLQPETLKDADMQQQLARMAPEVMVVVAYGLLLPATVLDMPTHGCINVHASLLPRWRGAAPIARAIAAGDTETGVTIMQMARGLDTGDMLNQQAVPMTDSESAGDLHDTLAQLGGQLLAQTLADIEQDRIVPTPQDHDQATYAAKLHKAEAALDWTRPATELARLVRAFHPWPVAHGELGGKRVRIWRAQAQPACAQAKPGTVLAAGEQGVDVASGAGCLRITELQWPGKRRMAAAEAARGHDLVGQRFA